MNQNKLINFIKENEFLIGDYLNQIDEVKNYIQSKYNITDLETLYFIISVLYLKISGDQ